MDDVVFAPRAWAQLPVFAGYGALLSRVADVVDGCGGTWPAVCDYQALLGTGVGFVVQDKKLKAGIDAADVEGSYAWYSALGQVPSRERNLHDFLNALVWARLPRTKALLATLLVTAAQQRPRTHAAPVRTPRQDRLSMVDEGGVLACGASRIVLGHALLEDAIGGRTSRGYPVVVGGEDDDWDVRGARRVADMFAEPPSHVTAGN